MVNPSDANSGFGRSSSDNPLLAFVHLPKTGGTSLQVVLEKHSTNNRPVFNIAHPDQAREFLAIPDDEQEKYFAVFGHMPFGIHNFLKRPINYITFLRDPVERMLSAYAHILRQLDHPLHEEACRQGIAWTGRTCNLETTNLADYDFAEQPNDAGRYWWGNAPAARTRQETLVQAKANLQRCAFVGFTETYDEDIRALSDLRGTPVHIPAAIPREQTGSNRLKRSDLTQDQLERIQVSNAADMALYAYALELRQRWGGPLNPAHDASPPAARRHRRPFATPSPLSAAADTPDVWRPLRVALYDFLSGQPILQLPAQCRTPADAWGYGLGSDLIQAKRPGAVRIGVRSRQGRIGVCLMSENYADIVSRSYSLTPRDGATAVVIDLPEDLPPVRLLVRNHDDPGCSGEAEIHSMEIIERA